jgi:hypothetical protein
MRVPNRIAGGATWPVSRSLLEDQGIAPMHLAQLRSTPRLQTDRPLRLDPSTSVKFGGGGGVNCLTLSRTFTPVCLYAATNDFAIWSRSVFDHGTNPALYRNTETTPILIDTSFKYRRQSLRLVRAQSREAQPHLALWAGARSPLWRRHGPGSGSALGGPGGAVQGARPGRGPGW